jgi:N-formylglutamate deformylase
VYHLSCHCMSAVGAPTHPDPGKPRPDFCLGNLDGRTASDSFVEWVADVIRKLGYSCTINDPYSGGELNARYGDPAHGVESIMVEINKKLFMDVNTFRKIPDFDQVKAGVSKVLAAITKRARESEARPGR